MTMSTIEIKKIGITKLDTDAIVNAANEGLRAGGGVCGAIFAEAGHQRLQEACDKVGHCKTGSAVITPAFDLPAKYVIHAVGPIWRGGDQGEAKLLYSAYYQALELAVINGCESIAFPLISSGIFGYPVEQAWEVAFRACRDFLKQNYEISIRIIFAVLKDEMVEMGNRILEKVGGENAE